ncbi:lysylphosphatidylglycerol synthase transmembrane domain-containing protein [Sphingobium aquiterrae]|uniref:lysylphosphatidylglycerol synthase transmembrane domain-containing protein n=1 Tax=Sphingobium aquiterrae TaxID=2038656 RepID=UPI003018EB1E
MAAHPRSQGSGRMRVASLLFGLIALAALAALVLRFGDLAALVVTLRRAEPAWLLLAVGLQGATYACVASGWRAVLAKAGDPQPLRRLVPIAISKLFADQVIPGAGMGGNILLIDQLTGLGCRRSAAVAALIISMVGYYAVYALLALAMLVLLWLHHAATPLLVGVVTTFLLVALAIPSLALWLRGRGSKPLPRRIEAIPLVSTLLHVMGEAPRRLVTDRRLIATVAAWNGLVFLLDAATLQACMAALGQPVGFTGAFIALIAASVVMTLGPIPLGLGSFEASCTAVLHLLGTPLAGALAGTMLLRSLTLWLPLIPGLLLLRRSLARRRRKDRARAGTSGREGGRIVPPS